MLFLQYKFALIVMGRPQIIGEDSDYHINLPDFLPHPQSGNVFHVINFFISRNIYINLSFIHFSCDFLVHIMNLRETIN